MFKSTLSQPDSNDEWPPVALVLDHFEADLAGSGTHFNGMASAQPPPELKSSPRIAHNSPNVAPPRPTPRIGHNSNGALSQEEAKLARELADRIEAIVDSAYTGPQKLLLIKILLRCDYKTLNGAFPSYETLTRSASVRDDRTVKRAVDGLVAEDETGQQHGILVREYREGKSPIYGISRERLQALIADWIIRNRAKNAPPLAVIAPALNEGGTFNVPPTSDEGGHPPATNVRPSSNASAMDVPRSTLSLKANGKTGDAEATRPATPHLTPEGLVISADQGLMVPIQTVQQWKERFSDIPDLEAAMTKLATTMLAKGRMHAGWTCPEGWMVGLLAEMNQEAADKKRITEARIARAAKGAAPASVGRSRRSELDAA